MRTKSVSNKKSRKYGILNYRNAGAHTEDPKNRKILVNLQEEIYRYPQILEELPRFFSVLSYLFNLKWIQGSPSNILSAWDDLQLEGQQLASLNEDDLSTSTLRRSLKHMEWPNYIDEQRLENLMRHQLSKVIKIQGIGGLGKTALIYQTLRNLIDDDEWKTHEFYHTVRKGSRRIHRTWLAGCNQLYQSKVWTIRMEYGP